MWLSSLSGPGPEFWQGFPGLAERWQTVMPPDSTLWVSASGEVFLAFVLWNQHDPEPRSRPWALWVFPAYYWIKETVEFAVSWSEMMGVPDCGWGVTRGPSWGTTSSDFRLQNAGHSIYLKGTEKWKELKPQMWRALWGYHVPKDLSGSTLHFSIILSILFTHSFFMWTSRAGSWLTRGPPFIGHYPTQFCCAPLFHWFALGSILSLFLLFLGASSLALFSTSSVECFFHSQLSCSPNNSS